MFGVAYRRKLLAGQGALTLGVAMLVVNVALMWLGPYELSLVGIETQQLKNMTPPSLLLAGHAIMMCAFVIAAAPAIARWARRPRVWWLVAIGNTGAMTLYLWHIPALLFMHLVFDYLGHPRYDPSAPGFVAMSSVQVLVMGVLVAALFIMLRPLENNSLPLWDGGLVAATGWRSIAVGGLLCVAGAATLASVGWGLKGPGLYCVAVMLATLGRRPPAGHRPGPPKGSAGRRSHHDQRRQQELQCHASAALAAEFPSVLDRSVRSRLLVAAVLVSGAAGRLRLLTLQGFPEPLLVVVFRCISHSRSLARCTGGGRGLFPSTNSQRFPGGTPYRCEIGNVITTRRSSTIALR